jgi:hypothetical protein
VHAQTIESDEEEILMTRMMPCPMMMYMLVVILTYPMMGILLIMMVGFLIEVRSDKRE